MRLVVPASAPSAHHPAGATEHSTGAHPAPCKPSASTCPRQTTPHTSHWPCFVPFIICLPGLLPGLFSPSWPLQNVWGSSWWACPGSVRAAGHFLKLRDSLRALRWYESTWSKATVEIQLKSLHNYACALVHMAKFKQTHQSRQDLTDMFVYFKAVTELLLFTCNHWPVHLFLFCEAHLRVFFSRNLR